MEPHLRVQRLAQSAIILALGAVVMGAVGILTSWFGDAASSHVALILVIPGGVMVLVAAYILWLARRTEPDNWRGAYKRAVIGLETGALIGFFATIITAVMVRADVPTPQVLLIALVGIQGPFAMFLLTRQMSRALR
ncbi:MAG: hypothetical protein L0K34_06015 [Ancrocorticia sp.]|nr:hypothetical protein [Ancrocorticia sp.]